jgi:hypothetical protein
MIVYHRKKSFATSPFGQINPSPRAIQNPGNPKILQIPVQTIIYSSRLHSRIFESFPRNQNKTSQNQY